MKKTFIIVLLSLFLTCTFCLSANAYSISAQVVSVDYLANGDYIETVIEDSPAPSITKGTITKTKTRYYKNSSGVVLWSVSIHATFTYNGVSSTCTSCSHSTTSPGVYWSIKSASSSRSGNSATAYATATYQTSTISYDYDMSVTIYCSPYGIIS